MGLGNPSMGGFMNTEKHNVDMLETDPFSAKYIDHAKKEIVAARYFDIHAAAIEQGAQKG
jgi:uncharacterized membrane protein